MVLALEGARRSEFAGQHPGRKRQAGQNSDAAPLGFSEEQFAGPLAKNVEDNLHRLHARKFDGLEGLLHFLDAHSIMAQLAGVHQLVQNPEYLGQVENRGRWTVQLQQVNGVSLQIFQAAFDEARQIFPVITARFMRIEPPPGFGSHVKRLLSISSKLRQQTLAASITVNVGGIEEIYPEIQRPMQRGQRLLVVHTAP